MEITMQVVFVVARQQQQSNIPPVFTGAEP